MLELEGHAAVKRQNLTNSEAALWQHQCGRLDLSVAVGGANVFCADLFNKRRGEKDAQEIKTRALDIHPALLELCHVRYREALADPARLLHY